MTLALPETLKKELQEIADAKQRKFSDWLRLELAEIVKLHGRVSLTLSAADLAVAESLKAQQAKGKPAPSTTRHGS